MIGEETGGDGGGARSAFTPADAHFRERVEASFARQRVMATIGARLERVEPGEVDIAIGCREDLTQQHGFLHAGIIATVADSACGYAALTLMPASAGVLSIEFKVNLLAPAHGARVVARARVIRPGKNITVCSAGVASIDDAGIERLVATMLGTMMVVRDREGIED